MACGYVVCFTEDDIKRAGSVGLGRSVSVKDLNEHYTNKFGSDIPLAYDTILSTSLMREELGTDYIESFQLVKKGYILSYVGGLEHREYPILGIAATVNLGNGERVKVLLSNTYDTVEDRKEIESNYFDLIDSAYIDVVIYDGKSVIAQSKSLDDESISDWYLLDDLGSKFNYPSSYKRLAEIDSVIPFRMLSSFLVQDGLDQSGNGKFV